MTPYRIVLADDHVLLRHGIRSIIETAEDMNIVIKEAPFHQGPSDM